MTYFSALNERFGISFRDFRALSISELAMLKDEWLRLNKEKA